MADAMKSLQISVVTPEKQFLEAKADFIVLPMVDGELGVCPSHAAFIGRLGKGELRYTDHGSVKKLLIDGGFAQVRSDVVTVLTSRVS